MKLLPDRLTLMQRLQDSSRHGYSFYTDGKIDLDKWPGLSKKFSKEYEVDLPKSTRSRRRKSGEAVCQLIACEPAPYDSPKLVHWFLVATEGAGRVHVREMLKEQRSQRIELDGYELVHDGVCWTWQMTKKRYNYWRERIHQVAAKPPSRRSFADDGERFDPDIEKIQDALYNVPGFRLVRRQSGKLVVFLRQEWKRLRPENGLQPRVRKFMPYIQRLPNQRRAKAAN